MENDLNALFNLLDSSGDIDSEGLKKHLSTQCKVFYLTCYPEHFQKVGSNDIISDFKEYLMFFGVSKYYFILHDKDIDNNGEFKKAHFHVILIFDKLTTIGKVVNGFGQKNYPWAVQKLRNINAMLRYFTHMDYPDKQPYEISDIISNDFYVIDKIKYNLSDYAIFLRYFREAKENHEFVTMLELCEWCVKNGFESMIAKNVYLLRSLLSDNIK